jgi:hypothetical protein
MQGSVATFLGLRLAREVHVNQLKTGYIYGACSY